MNRCLAADCDNSATMGTLCGFHYSTSKGKHPDRISRRPIDANTVVIGRTQTSVLAARTALGRSGSQRRRIYDLVTEHPDGLTADDIQRLTGFPVNSVNPRVNELAGDGWLIDSGDRRLTRYGSPATVWRAA